MILTPDEIARFTGKSRSAAQARELEYLGVPFKRRRDGTLVVYRVHAEPVGNSIQREPQLRLRNG
jgi:hypothetical protein